MSKLLSLSLLLTLAACANKPFSERNPARASNSSVEEFYLKQCHHSDPEDFNSNPGNVSEAQRAALYSYTLGAYKAMNSQKIEPDECTKAAITLMSDALDSISSTEGTFYRGDDTKHESLAEGKVTAPAKLFLSYSQKKEVADGFIKDRFWTTKVKHAKSIRAYSNDPRENEFILNRGTRFKIDKIQVKPMQFDISDDPEHPKMETRNVEFVWATEVD